MRGFLASLPMAAVLALVILPPPAQAACSSLADTEAEDAMRFEMRLMVASSICTKAAYDDFLRHVGAGLSPYISRASHLHHPIDSYLTHLANEEGLAAGHLTIGQYCESVTVELFDAASKLAVPQDFSRFITAQATAEMSSQSCPTKHVAANHPHQQ
jgi:hypothetical protein